MQIATQEERLMTAVKEATDLRHQHTCEGLVRTCIDFRFWNSVKTFVEEHYPFAGYDFSAEAGGVKNIIDQAERQAGIKGILISCRLHSMKTIVLTAHRDCGAYGGSKSFESPDMERTFHIDQLKKARDIIEQILQSKQEGCFDENGNYIQKQYVFLWVDISADGKRVEIEDVTNA